LHTILEIKGLQKRLAGTYAIKNISMSVAAGSISTIIGGNGAGKTTLFNLVGGYLTPDCGSILYRGEDISGLSISSRARGGIGRLWQDRRLFQNMTVLENLLVAIKGQTGQRITNYLHQYKRIKSEGLNNRALANQILDELGLTHKSDALTTDLSYGEQKLLAIGRLLMNDADVLLLDEPLGGLNHLLIDRCLDLVTRLAAKGKTVLIIEHNITKILGVSDWVFGMNRGDVVYSGSPNGDSGISEMLGNIYGYDGNN
jgi:ABC-type branched-subunit amino acid transport system ATPase component